MEDKPENEPENDDERARRAAADELQKQIDALVRGDATTARPDKPRSLRDFIEHGDGRRSNKPQRQRDKSPDEAPSHPAIESADAVEEE